RVLAWLPTAENIEVPSALLGKRDEQAWLLVTTARTALVALTPLGDSHLEELVPAPLEVTGGIGRSRASLGARAWKLPLGATKRWNELAATLAVYVAVRDAGAPADLLAAVWRAWPAGPAAVRPLIEAGTQAYAVELHRRLHATLVAPGADLLDAAEADAELADHLSLAGERA